MTGRPDFKAPPRIKDKQALRDARPRAMRDGCAACGSSAGSIHHVVRKGSPYFGDDVAGNLLGLCGDGTRRCHGAWHGSPYVVQVGDQEERRDQEWVAARIGAFLLSDRPDVIEYVLGKLGEVPGREYLSRHYRVLLPATADAPA